eukprot:s1799_g2.t1
MRGDWVELVLGLVGCFVYWRVFPQTLIKICTKHRQKEGRDASEVQVGQQHNGRHKRMSSSPHPPYALKDSPYALKYCLSPEPPMVEVDLFLASYLCTPDHEKKIEFCVTVLCNCQAPEALPLWAGTWKFLEAKAWRMSGTCG